MLRFAVLTLLPVAMYAQTTVPPAQPDRYRDNIFSPGETPGAPALTPQQKLQIHLQRMIAPRVFVGALLVAGYQEGRNTHPEWGRTWTGFGKRYGTDLAVNAVRETIAEGLDAVTHQDPRYFRSQRAGLGPRLRDAVGQVLWAYTDSGGRSFAWANVISAYGATQIGVRWVPVGQRSTGDGFIYGSLLLAGDAGRNAFREFWPDVRRKIHHR